MIGAALADGPCAGMSLMRAPRIDDPLLVADAGVPRLVQRVPGAATSIDDDAMHMFGRRRSAVRAGQQKRGVDQSLLEHGLCGARARVPTQAVRVSSSRSARQRQRLPVARGRLRARTLVLMFLFFARSARPLGAQTQPLVARLQMEPAVRTFYE